MPKYRVNRHISIPRKPGGDPNDSIEIPAGTTVTEAKFPKRINLARLVARGVLIKESE